MVCLPIRNLLQDGLTTDVALCYSPKQVVSSLLPVEAI